MSIRLLVFVIGFLGALLQFAYANEISVQSKVVIAEQVTWGYLNPLRGDKSPAAAELWGDRTKTGPTGMLVRFKKGFSSPPHIHNITYRGVVIEGLLHNDDPQAQKMWMPTGSFWTQPAGEDHITSANGDTNLIYLEIESGPYLVKPSAQRFDNGERPLNLHIKNMVWSDSTSTVLIKTDKAQLASLWGSDTTKLTGRLLKLKKGFKGTIRAAGPEFKAVVIKGEVAYRSKETKTNL